MPVLSWGPSDRRKIEAARDAIFQEIGTDEPLYEEDMRQVFGDRAITVNWRKPLRIDEVNRLAPTPDVRARPGRA